MGTVTIKQATLTDAEAVGSLVHVLIREIVPEHEDRKSKQGYIETTSRLLEHHTGIWAFLAESAGNNVGVLTLNECAAIYAGGLFGEICELYVVPEFRSAGVGEQLIDAAVVFARAKDWPVIEVGAPDIPRWQKSVDFYQRCGFETVGLRLELDITR